MFPNPEIKDVVSIGDDLYAKTPEALSELLAHLADVGYRIDDLRDSDDRKKRGVSVEDMERGGQSLWFAHLDIRRGKCGSCGQHISICGIRMHGHKCELCGKVTYYDIVDGSTIRFSFIQSGWSDARADITMTAYRWDTKRGYLYLYPKVSKGLWLGNEAAQAYFKKNNDKWERVTKRGRQLIRIKYPNPWRSDVSAIEPSDVHGSFWNHRIVRVWDGKEYGEFFENLPVPEYVSIYEAWHWAPLDASPYLHKKLLGAIRVGDDKGWFHQDGRAFFNDRSFSEMGKFVRHFTTLDADRWDEESKRFRRSGPGGIDDVAAFCHPSAETRNVPNVGNLLYGYHKLQTGLGITEGELAAMADALKDPEAGEVSKSVMAALRRR